MVRKVINQNEIIVVDDNPDDRFIAHRCYKKSGLSNPWLEFSNGPELLEYLALVEVGTKPMPAVILLDINMPLMTGIEVLQIIREKATFKDLPILTMLSGSENPTDIQKAKDLGADGYYSKPSNLDQFISFFKEFTSASFARFASASSS